LRKWAAIISLGAAQFVMVLDTTVMNVSLTQIASDLDTTINDLQTAITCYALTMAAFMLTGGKLGDVWGRRRTFAIGMVVYGVGSFITAISQNLPMLLIGWSLIEGLGAALVIPAIMSLAAGNYEGHDRAVAYGILGGIAAAGAAVGPLLGGLATEYLSWRVVFAGETVVMLILLAFIKVIADAPAARRPKIDLLSVVLSATGMGLVVLGILKISDWGFIQPRGGPEINGDVVTPLGTSLVPWLIVAGLAVLVGFYRRQEHLEESGGDPLVRPAVLGIPQMRSGLSSMSALQLVLNGTFFVIPVYLQVILGKNAIETGVKVLPMSFGVVILSLIGARLAVGRSPRSIVRAGFITIVVGCLMLAAAVNLRLDDFLFGLAMFIFGGGVGLGISQLPNVIMSSVGEKSSSEAGGLQGTFQYLGASLGTALIGAALLSGLTTGFADRIQSNPALSDQDKTAIVQKAGEGVPVASDEQVRAALRETSLSAAEQDAVADDYADAQQDALKRSLLLAALLGLAGLLFVRRLPREPLAHAPPAAAA
jgi:MFS family permease